MLNNKESRNNMPKEKKPKAYILELAFKTPEALQSFVDRRFNEGIHESDNEPMEIEALLKDNHMDMSCYTKKTFILKPKDEFKYSGTLFVLDQDNA
tara:strand:+ start:13 stop:300 length:288 start_codon:yes stop_codon:yes gene_type:complete